MGLDYRTLHLLATEVFKTHHPKSCICLGRPHYFGVNKETVRLCKEFRLEVRPELLEGEYRQRFADNILKAFGILRLEHMDVFPEEGATIIHDLNTAIPEKLRNQFDLVLDNGTLEHIFNIPQALENCASLCAIGGCIVMIAPANNYCGHGFFQFSPELFYRAFCESNGFAETRVHLLDYGVLGTTLTLVDPALKKSRLEFINSSQVVMVGIARKTRDKKPFWTQWPQQSDYVVYWNTAERRNALEHQAPGFEVFLLNNFPRLSRILQGLKFSSLNPKMRLRSNR
ncbi:MAG TPA: class I SAM-dependent methyltransferase [Verrucomicrobiae bacterium]|nr:class I SAM-dependent methyltransferase [Verrucomicrobiae bacterium]